MIFQEFDFNLPMHAHIFFVLIQNILIKVLPCAHYDNKRNHIKFTIQLRRTQCSGLNLAAFIMAVLKI